MNEILDVLRIAAALALIVAPPILIARLIAGPDQATLADLLAFTAELSMPPGVREAEQPAFRFDQLDAKRRRSRRPAKPEPAPLARIPSSCVDDRAA